MAKTKSTKTSKSPAGWQKIEKEKAQIPEMQAPSAAVAQPSEREVVKAEKPEKSTQTKVPVEPIKQGAAEESPKIEAMKNKESLHHRHPASVPIGGIFVLLALIGLITVVVISIQTTSRLIDNSKEKERFENIILPVLMFDPVPFEKPSEMDDMALLRSSIWSAIVQNKQKYTFNDSNMVTVPQSDVDVACKKLFGSEVKLKHQAFDDYLSIYSYDEETKMYYVPVDASVLYTPQVDEISKKGDVLSLMVGYLAPDNPWMMSIKGEKEAPIPSKHMIYELQKIDGNYQLLSIKDPPEGAIPGIPQIAEPAEPAPQPVIPAETLESPINPEDKTQEEDQSKAKQLPPNSKENTPSEEKKTDETI